MRLLTFHTPTGLQLGIKTERGIIDVARAGIAFQAKLDGAHIPATFEELCSGSEVDLSGLHSLMAVTNGQQGDWLLVEEQLQFGPSASRYGKIICVGLNYRKHAAESNMAIPESPVLFPKYSNALAGTGEDIPLSPNATQYDYEAELALVIGKRAQGIEQAEALDYVLGYANGHDLSARDLQFRTPQWMLGKIQDKFLPIGPYLVTADEVTDPQNLSIKLWLNGEIRQNSNTADMIFNVAYIVSYLSQYLTLEPGDIIITGTPEGVILGHPEYSWLKAGDTVTIEVGNLGELTNKLS
ncbi:fumarylacetoacetate hydrolase family protein [Dictyobacter arantiisoli]|uniref:2-hydroxyhepta-2,4-diene-1,7-dioate isomerase n=1 Tax=Dictyobacter arantiisoli TaxID=2014874 RepID=A0A5A5TBN1_9CHLR|nr:fumarylacetoacetate hydrolase family protein [Dictyobacter arantiisoli]GCF08767.1 2-hydroxyhepta-2,4-diene-1,7-dioate isomerase [Dictyobacter arantiisoli]